ncbi:MAG: hypothetical protein LC777_22555, partial [Actinobacteria bacterium]|nr:hypothetical protein [Actinomycetota bacterium]
MALMLHRGGHERIDVATELLKYLRYRYELSERALVHHAKLAADAMIGRLFEAYVAHAREELATRAWHDAGSPPAAVPEGATPIDEAQAWVALDPARDKKIAEKSRARLERRMLRHGDDGLIEHMVDADSETDSASAAVVADLARRIQSRR